MTDIASLGIKIDTTQTVAATSALDKFAAAAKPAAANVAALEKAATGASKGTSAVAASGQLARHEMINLSRQIQDVGVSLASGQSPFMVLAQQGTQIADIFSNSQGSVGGAIKQMASGIASVLTPARLLAGGIAALGLAGYAAYSSWKTFALQLDDTAKAAGIASSEMAKLQAAASFKGISGDDFTKGIENFSQQVYLARNYAGGLRDVFIANGIATRDFTGSLEQAANLIKNARDDQQRLVLLQQMGLPANMQWVRLMSDGADGIRWAKNAATEFGGAANDEMVAKAREFDEAWNRTWTNWGLQARSAVVTVGGWLDALIEKGRKGLMSAGVDVGGNLLRNGLGTPLGQNFDDFYKATGHPSKAPGGNTTDPAAIQRALSLEQQRIGVLGQTASLLDVIRGVEIQIQQARLNGINVTKEQEATLKRLAAEQALGITAIKASTDAQRVEAETVGMSVGQAAAYAAAQNAINEARRSGRPLTEDNIAAIQREASALGDAAKRADDMKWSYENMVRGPLQTFRQELANGATFFDALKKAGLSALDALSTKLMDMAAQSLWQNAFGGKGGGLFGLLGSFFGGGGGGGTTMGLDGLAALHHTGYGPGDAITATRLVHPAYFDDAPRFHSGIGPGERAAIIRKDESVLTPGQMKALAPVSDTTPITITQNVTFNNADPGSEARIRAGMAEMKRQAVQEAIKAVAAKKANTPGYLV